MNLLKFFNAQGFNMRYQKNLLIQTYQEEAALVHYGHRRKNIEDLGLVDLVYLENVELINHLNYIQPDFMLFQHNEYLWNDKTTRLAGCPDLVVEVWSEGETRLEKDVKFQIYCNSNDKTEHWYIEQDSNIIGCYLGENKLDEQSLTSPLKTIHGLEFDLTHLSL